LKTWGSRAELELGRSCFQAGDRDEAQRIIRECVKRTPDFLPAWKALLRFSAAVQLPEAQAIAAEARQLFPLCYTVALIASEIGSVAEQAESLLGALDAFAPSISEDERFLARPEFVRAVRAFVRRWPQSEHNLAVLKRASEIFPESAHIVIEAVTDAHLRGDFQSELLYQRRLHALFQNAEVIAKELGALDECPVMWDVADFLLRFN
jgi:tetratricopeptide (TPR) repeat protein